MYSEDELIPISTLQHMVFCPRQAGLILLERIWDENVLTVEGHDLHEHAHTDEADIRNDIYTVRGLRIRSLRLGLVGMTDVVEFHRIKTQGKTKTATELPGHAGLWQPFIIEYKRGAPKIDRSDEVQICAQAICLEEMLNVSIKESSFFYGKLRHRHVVSLSKELRQETEGIAEKLHLMLSSGNTPAPVYNRKCRNCSLIDQCLPKAATTRLSTENYLKKAIASAGKEE